MDHRIRLNGEERSFAVGTTVEDLVRALEEEGLVSDRRVLAVERNRSIVPRSTYAVAALESGDEVEIVTIVGGG